MDRELRRNLDRLTDGELELVKEIVKRFANCKYDFTLNMDGIKIKSEEAWGEEDPGNRAERQLAMREMEVS
jgi:hypothetical protein